MTVYKTGAGFYAPDDASRTLDLNTAKIQTLSYATGCAGKATGFSMSSGISCLPISCSG